MTKVKIIRSKFPFGHNLYEVILWMNRHQSIHSRKCMLKNLMWEDKDMDKYTYKEICKILEVELTENDVYKFEIYLHKIFFW